MLPTPTDIVGVGNENGAVLVEMCGWFRLGDAIVTTLTCSGEH